MVTSVTKGGIEKLPKKFKIDERKKRYWPDHSLERSWGALSDDNISFSIQLFSMKKNQFFEFFAKKTPSLKR
jgi:hypothetical protein